MCVICYMDRETRLPDYDIIDMFTANPDGAGICYPDKGRVIIEKGFFSVGQLLDAYHGIPEDVPLIVHCRIATSGQINEKTCHPFAVGKTLKKANRRACSIAVAHNGVLSGLGCKDASDTQEYVTRVVAPLIHKSGYNRLEDMGYILDIIRATSQGCRFALMDATGHVELIGEWLHYNGALVSNLNFSYESPAWMKRKEPAKLFDACSSCVDSDWCGLHGALCMNEKEAEVESAYSREYNDETTSAYLINSWYGLEE